MAAELKQVHYVTRVDRTGDGNFDPVSYGILEVPQQKAEGAAGEAVLGHIQNFQCDGFGDGTAGANNTNCEQLHQNAVERVIARVTPEGDLAVTWRRYHPRIAAGVARPDAPFEFFDEVSGTTVRVEVREIDYALINGTETEVIDYADQESMPIADVERQLTAQKADHQREREIDQQRREAQQAFEISIETPIEEFISRVETEFGDALRVGEMLDDLIPVADGSQPFTDAFLEFVGNPKARVDFTAATNTANAMFEQALEPANQWFNKNVSVNEQKVELKNVAAQATTMVTTLNADQQVLVEVLKELQDIESKEMPIAPDEIDAVVATQEKLAKQLEELMAPLEAAFENVRAEQEAFQTRVEAIAGWKDGTQLQAGKYDIERGQAYPGFGVKYWTTEFEKVALRLEVIAAQLDDQPKSHSNADDVAEIEKIENEIAAIFAPFSEKLWAEFEVRRDARVNTIKLGDRELELPELSIRVLNNNGGSLNVEVDACGVEDCPMIVKFFSDTTPNMSREFILMGSDEIYTHLIENAQGPFHFEITAVATQPPADDQIEFEPTRIVSKSLDPKLEGALLFAPARGFKVHAPPDGAGRWVQAIDDASTTAEVAR